MTSTLVACVNCKIVINELLCFIQNKISIADEISLVRICASAFSSEQIEKANNLLLESIPSDLRKPIRKGKGKENRLLHDIINLFKVTDPDVLPVFVAQELEKLPPITFDHLDVSKLLKDLILVQEEIKNIKSSYATVAQLEDIKRECRNEKLASPPFSAAKVNMKRGAYRDSGPIGLSQLDDTIVTTVLEQSDCEASSPKEFNLNCRNIDMAKTEGSKIMFQNNVPQQASEGVVIRCSEHNSAGGMIHATPRMSSAQSDPPIGTAQKQTYAGVVRFHDLDEGWTVVKRKTQKFKDRLIGKMGNVVVESEEKFRAADKKIPLFITNVHKDTAEKDIINYIKTKTNENITLEKISIKRQCEHNAYKLFVSQSKVPLYLDENLWPQGIIFRRFVHFKYKRSNEPVTEVSRNNLPTFNG